MQRDESSANPPSEDPREGVGEATGSGTAGPGDLTYERESQTGDVGGEAELDLEDKAQRMAAGDPGSDPAAGAAADGPPEPNPDEVSENPEVQSGG